jgi:replicative DNA helicase
MERIEKTILKNLLHNEEFTRRVFPFLEPKYFLNSIDRIVFQQIYEFIDLYKNRPTKEALIIDLSNHKKITETEFQSATDLINELKEEEKPNDEWLVAETEKFCQEKAIYDAVMNSIQIIDGKDKRLTKDSIPEILSDALGVSFDTHVGHDYIENVDERFDFYHRVEDKIPFDLDFFNKITKGGLPKKTLNIALAGTGVGKSLFMCHVAANCLMQGKNVLYVTMEMAEERIAERIDANLLNLPIDDIHSLPKDLYERKIDLLKMQTTGKLIIKEYPTATAHTGHLRTLLNELKLKRNFAPEIVFVDYLNICASSRFKYSANVNSYTYVKAIAEELRGLAVEMNIPIVSATQTTRSGFNSSDPGLEDTSESFGLPATADFMFALVTSEELDNLDQVMIKQLKNRYNDLTVNKRFVIGIDRSKMKLYDLSQSAQENITDSGQIEEDIPKFDKSKFGQRMFEEKDFGGIKV